MKTEVRAKYSGMKAHFDAKECQELLDWRGKAKAGKASPEETAAWAVNFCKKVASTIKDLLEKHPDMLQERTEDQIKAALLKDQKKIKEQLDAMGQGKDWKQVA